MSHTTEVKDNNQSIIFNTIEKATNTANEAEDASFAGLFQEAIKKYLTAASQYLDVLKYTRDEETIKGMSFLAEIQRSKAKDLMSKIESRQVVIQKSYFGNINNSQEAIPSNAGSSTRLHSASNPVLPVKKAPNAPRDFSWQRFWQHVEELLEILPKPIFDDPSLPQFDELPDYIVPNNIDNNKNNNNNLKNSNNIKKEENIPTRLTTTFPPLHKVDEDFFAVKVNNQVPLQGNLFFPIHTIDNYDPAQSTFVTTGSQQSGEQISKDEKIRMLEEENLKLKQSIVRFRQEVQIKAKKLHIFEPTEDDLKSHEIECGIGMYIGKQLQKIGQLEVEVSSLRDLITDLTQKYQEQLQRNQLLEKKWNDFKQLAHSKEYFS